MTDNEYTKPVETEPHTALMGRRTFLTKSTLAAGAAVSVGALGSLLESCGSTSSGASTSNSIKLTIMYDDSNELSQTYGPLYEKLNPGTKVEVLKPDPTRLSSMLAAGQPPDLVRVGSSAIPGYAARGIATDITPYLEKSSLIKISDLQPSNNSFRWDGNAIGQGPYYGLDKDWSPDGEFWYNKQLFDQAHVPYLSETQPITYDELLELAKKLTVFQGNKIRTYGLDTAWEFGFTYGEILSMLTQEQASLFSKDLTKADFTQPQVKKVLQWFVDWAKARVGPSPLDVGDTAFDLFAANRLAMVTFGYWFGGAAILSDKNGLGEHVGFAPAPQWGNTRITTFGDQTGFFIPASSKNKDAAWKFLEWFIGGQPGEEHSKQGFGIPPLKHFLSNLPQTRPWQKQSAQVVSNDLPSITSVQFSPYASSTAVNQSLQDTLTSVIKGQNSLDAALIQLNTTINLLLKQGKEQIG